MYLLYGDQVIGQVPDDCKCISDAFESLGIRIMCERDCKIAYARQVPGFYASADGYYLDVAGCKLCRCISV